MGSYSIRDVTIVHQLDRAEKDMQDLKSKQFVSRRGLATKKNVSQLVPSRTTLIGVPTPVAIQTVYMNVFFKADTQPSPFGRLALEFYNAAGNLLDTSSGIVVNGYTEYVTDIDDGLVRWAVDIRANPAGTLGSAQFFVKFIVYGTDTGRISWENIWTGA